MGTPVERVSPRQMMFRRNFFPYFVGNLTSNSGTWLGSIAQILLIYRLTGSTFMVGVVNFAQFAGMLISTPIGGSVADRFDRRRLLMVCQLIAAALTGVMALLTATDLITVPLLIVLVLASSIVVALSTPTLQALVVSLVAQSEIPTAIALQAVTFNLARVIGPIVGALVVTHLGFGWAFGLNALSFLTLVIGVSMVRTRPSDVPRPTSWPKTRDLLGLLRENPQLASLLAVGAAVSLAMDPLNTLGPAFATEIFGRPDTLAGTLIALFGVGAVVAAFTLSWRRTGSPERIALTLGLMTLGMLIFALSSELAIAFPALLVAGFGYLSSTTGSTTQIHQLVSDDVRGRVMSLWTLTFLGVRPLAAMADGALATVAGVRVATIVMTLPALLVATWMVSEFRRRRRQEDEEVPQGAAHDGDGPETLR